MSCSCDTFVPLPQTPALIAETPIVDDSTTEHTIVTPNTVKENNTSSNVSDASKTSTTNDVIVHITHNTITYPLPEATEILRTGRERLQTLEADLANKSADMQQLLRMRNTVQNAHRRTGRLRYVCELNSLQQQFEIKCEDLRFTEENYLQLEHEMQSLQQRIRRARHDERKRQRAADKKRKSATSSSADESTDLSTTTTSSFSETSSLSSSTSALTNSTSLSNPNDEPINQQDSGTFDNNATGEIDRDTGDVTDDDAEVPSRIEHEEEDIHEADEDDEDDEEGVYDDDYDQLYDVTSFYDGLSTSV